MRSIIADGLLQGGWPQESYGSVVQNIWTAGRIGSAAAPTWDLGRPPLDPEDVYLGELAACLSQISEGITMTCDTSQSSHTPEYTDAMIEGLMDSGQRALYDYSGGTDRGGGFEYPGAIGNETSGVGRLRKQFFSSNDQLVTLGLATGPGQLAGQTYTGWQLARHFGCVINNHNVGAPATVINAAADPRNGTDWSDVCLVHCVRWQDAPVAQIGLKETTPSQAMQIFADRGGHVSIANLIEQQMRHGMPPFQNALNHGILPSLSPDVDTNMTTDPFSLMRGAFCQQRGLANDLALAASDPAGLQEPQLVTSRQCIEMATIAGAAGNGVLSKVGTLTPGKEADIVMLNARNINLTPMNNAPGTVVTMMNARHVQHVMIAGKFKFWDYELVGVDPDRIVRKLERAYEKVLKRIQGPALAGAIPPGNNSLSNPYRPNFLGSCCYNGQNTVAPAYSYRP
jgi:cytosine/adenosine deaminase-related metal-dependent hydrolase